MSNETKTTQNEVAKDSNKRSANRDTHAIEAMPNEFGEVGDMDTERYPEGSAARDGKATGPSGQGGMTPKSRPDYQDSFPANPPPSESARAWAEKIKDVGAVQAHSDAIAEEAGRSNDPKKK